MIVSTLSSIFHVMLRLDMFKKCIKKYLDAAW